MYSQDCSANIPIINTTESVCGIQGTTNDTIADLHRCCSGSVETTDCLSYCKYDTSKVRELDSCLGGSPSRVFCQNGNLAQETLSASSTLSSTLPKTAPPPSPTVSRSGGNPLRWSKAAGLLMMVSLVGQTWAREHPDKGTILSCADGNCDTCNVGNHGGANPSQWPLNGEGYPNCAVWSSASFKGAETKSSSGAASSGYDVFWSIDEPDPTCSIIVMSPVGPDVAGSNCGNVVLTANKAGCYYTHLKDTFMTQYCCGSGDCGKANPGKLMRYGKRTPVEDLVMRDGDAPLYTFNLEEVRANKSKQDTNPQSKNKLKSRSNNLLEASLIARKDDVKCENVKNKGEGYTKAEKQQKASGILDCDQGSCPQAISFSASVSHSVTSETSKTIGVSEGVSVSIEVGMDFIIESKVNAGLQATFSQSVTKSSGVSDTTTKTSTVTSTYNQTPGTHGYIWFAPTSNCQDKTMTCAGEEITVSVCDPALLGSGQPDGEYGFTSVA